MEGPSKFSATLPDEVIEDIFDRLPAKNKGRCSQVCRQWNRGFHSKHSWRTFTFKDGVFVRCKFTQHSGWQYHIDHWRLKNLITNTTHSWRTLNIEPVTNIFNLYEFFRVLANYAEHYEKFSNSFRPMGNIRNFNFKWHLHVDENETGGFIENKDVGTGGQILGSLSKVLKYLHGLQSLTLEDLQLTHDEADEFIMTLLEKYQEKLTCLSLLNLTLHPKPFIQVGCFLKLRKLAVSPQMLCADTLSVIACLEHLETFSIVQDEKSSQSTDISRNAWNLFTHQNMGRTRVWLILRGKPKESLIIQPGAPVYGIRMEDSAGQLTTELAEQIANFYQDTLRHFVQCGLERMKRGKKMEDRVDSALVEIVSRCTLLERVACRERMSYGTAIILSVYAARNGFKLWIRRNALLKRICWCRTDMETHAIFFNWLRSQCQSEELAIGTVQENTNHLSVLDDKTYKALRI
uniref:F-box domain-containing protein n=1 Tax=Caenorhabditis tropicalis TaxID=1561998 RepID=A0A1I7TNF3_9PELO